ncbi:rRNA pseudouridine synthase [Arenimonas sp. MALMAid1274]|uniref:rRNA pseudouridine synthase n=1 Tax=Arenimonas sp. MALMAid1274 TaxID=3411630 RepID=UPI003B9FDDD9
MTQPVRLSKRVVEIAGCSRSEAEQYVQGGWVRVDGVVVEEPQFKVLDQQVTLDPDARLVPAEPATMLLHKPAGQDPAQAASLLVPDQRWPDDPSGWRLHTRHFAHQAPGMPLEPEASGLMVLSQDGRVLRRLKEDSEKLEQEFIVEVTGELAPYGWKRLTGGTSYQGWPVAAFKVSWQSETRLRFAIKGVRPGLLQFLCTEVGLQAVAIKRIRLGRVPLSKMPPGQWRYLPVDERF